MYIKTVADVLRLTATQNIAQRGHIKSEGSDKGNFLEMLQIVAKHNPLVAKNMKGQHNAKYTSKYYSKWNSPMLGRNGTYYYFKGSKGGWDLFSDS